MKFSFKKVISLFLCFFMLCGNSINVFATNNTPYKLDNTKILENTNEVTKIEFTDNNYNGTAEINKVNGKITVEICDSGIINVYEVEINSIKNNKLAGNAINKDTGEIIEFDESYTNSINKRAAFIVAPLAPLIVGAIEVLLASSGVVVVGGVAVYTMEKVEELKKKSKKFDYWQAEIVSGKILFGRPLSNAEATTFVDNGGSVLARNQEKAMLLVLVCGGLEKEHDKHEKGVQYKPHYHPKNSPKSHIWY